MDSLRIPDRLVSRLPGRFGERADRSVVSLVRLHGVITPAATPVPRALINIAVLDKVLERAFAPDRLAAVALQINSPGGSATQSALVADRIRGLAVEHDVPVLAFCEDVAASGGYWLACAADEIYAHATSLVGSIGVVTQSFGLEGLLQRVGVERRLYTAGEWKSRLDPFLPEKPEDVEWLRGLQGQLHEMFQQWVIERRGDRLKTGADLFTGDVWTGAKAVELGLVDGLGTPQAVLAERFPDAEITTVEARKPLLARLGLGAPAALSAPLDALLGAVEAVDVRTRWARYGL
ncbi:S49 family peptidase [Pseudonocardia asaccharolytica]|uniref:Serine protease n=1 Tax=Pseudonocardia asaccharolytica DSM 44247 = NBRC 16224 TaxID=1123024 RepID=A0A511CV48_9PSEU|nr:S49 family peptidase [Pseudonocardia asaccharolytica]GEL16449.1 serine protease [Pseudonocardia asaccharolytica DSM 44247 = NBRC 16224]